MTNTQLSATIAANHEMPSFCKACQQARTAPDYAARFAALLDQLFCSICQREYSAIYFSAFQRKKSHQARKCISYEGYCTICLHLKISLTDVQKLALKDGQEKTIRCQDSSCIIHNARIEFWRIQESIYASCQWSISLSSTTGPLWERCLAGLQCLYQSCPEAFCPHLQTTPDQLNAQDFRKGQRSGRFNRKMHCLKCSDIIYCNLLGSQPTLFSGWGRSSPISMTSL